MVKRSRADQNYSTEKMKSILYKKAFPVHKRRGKVRTKGCDWDVNCLGCLGTKFHRKKEGKKDRMKERDRGHTVKTKMRRCALIRACANAAAVVTHQTHVVAAVAVRKLFKKLIPIEKVSVFPSIFRDQVCGSSQANRLMIFIGPGS